MLDEALRDSCRRTLEASLTIRLKDMSVHFGSTVGRSFIESKVLRSGDFAPFSATRPGMTTSSRLSCLVRQTWFDRTVIRIKNCLRDEPMFPSIRTPWLPHPR